MRAQLDAHADITYFKIGEGGFTGSPRVPKAPDHTLLDLESEGEPQTGAVGFTNSSTAVTGSGTAFLAEFAPGQWIKPGPLAGGTYASSGQPGSEVDEWGEIATVNSNTSITLVAPYDGATVATGAGRAPHRAASPLYTFRKPFGGGDIVLVSEIPAITEFECLADGPEANATQLLADPEFFELGLFDANGVMVVYATVDQQTKNSGVSLLNVIQLFQ